jgi:hypothetical protein
MTKDKEKKIKKHRVLKKEEIVEFTSRLLGLFSKLFSDYGSAVRYDIPELKVGDWAIERSYLGQFPIEGILKITNIYGDGGFSGVDLIGEKRNWENSDFMPLPKYCQDYLNGKYRF